MIAKANGSAMLGGGSNVLIVVQVLYIPRIFDKIRREFDETV